MAISGSSQSRVLVVDDVVAFREPLARSLENEGYLVEVAGDGMDAVEKAASFEPDVIVLDLTMPLLDGLEACRRIRSFSQAYVIMLTSRENEVDKMVGFSAGADDYMTKPYSLKELLARIQAMLRRPRTKSQVDDRRRFGNLEIDPQAREVIIDSAEIVLTRIEFDLLETLSSNPKTVFSREVLRERVWGPNWFGDDHVVDVHIANLRKKIDGAGSSYLKTVRGVGYRMADLDS